MYTIFTVSRTKKWGMQAIRDYKRFLSLATLLVLFALPGAWGAVGIDVTVSGDGASASTTISAPPFSTHSANELLLAFVSTDYLSGSNTTVQSIAGGALTWVLVTRSNVQSGSSEIWRAYATSPLSGVAITATLSQKVFASITVITFAGTDSSGTNGSAAIGATASTNASRGAPTGSLVTTRNNSWVFGVGNDFDNPLPRTPGSAQSLIHLAQPSVGDTYWVQMQNAPTSLSGTTVTINDTAPTGDRYNLAIVEVLPALGGGGSTFNISGNISPSSAGSGALVTLSGAASAIVTADASGNYNFTGLANGSYTVTPSKAGFTFSPSSLLANVGGASVSGINFTAQAIASWSISGTIGGTGCSGCSFVQSTHSSQSGHTDWPTLLNVKAGDVLVYMGEFTNWTPGALVNMTDSHGNTWHRCDNNATSDFVEIQDQTANGMSCQYAVNTAAWPTITAQPVASQCVNISCTQVGGAFFELALPATATARAWATPQAGISASGINNVSCGSITLAEANDFLLCDFNNASGTPTAGTTPVPFTMRETVVTAIETGLFSGSGTVTPTGTLGASGIPYTGITVAFGLATGGAGATVTLSGSSNASTVADANGDYSFTGLANGPYTVTPGKTGYTFAPTNQSVTVNGANQTGINFAVQAANSWVISGTISPSTSGSGATVVLSGVSSATVIADASGAYSFSGLANGSYTVTPTKAGFSFSPTSASVNVNGANTTGVSFTASATIPTWSVSGVITPSAAGSGAAVALTGTATAGTTADGSGNFTFAGLSNGSYTVVPSKAGFTFSPASLPANVNGANVSGINFTGTPQTWSISGTISPSSAAAGATVTLSGAANATATPDASGNYIFSALANGSYTVTPTEGGYTFNPSSQTTAVNGGAVTGLNFTAQTAGTQTLAIDATSSRALTAKATTVSTPVFSTNSGNELLLAFIAGDYISGTNTTVTGVTGAGLNWALVRRTNVQSGTSEIWRAFAPTSLSGVTVTATLSQSVVSSITILSFSGADGTGSNGSGAIGATATANAASGTPSASLVTTRNNSLVLGVGNDFDNAIARTGGTSQSLVFQVLTTTGDTYWVQRQNTTTPVSGTPVAINDTAPAGDRYNLSLVEVLPAGSGGVATPPNVSMTSPAPNATVSGQTSISASASDPYNSILGVQFLLDRSDLGAEVTSAPYSLTWDTTGLSGTHTLAAVAYNSAGLNATSTPITVTVDNSGNGALVGSWSSPVTLPTVAVNLVLLKNNRLLFYEDGDSVTVWDYLNNTFTGIPVNVDLFCSGHAVLADGRVLVVGGFSGSSNPIGIANAEIFDPSANTWTTVPSMAYRRWYPTATTLSDGRVLVTAGWQTSNHSNAGIPEIYNPSTNSWTQVASANNPFETYPFIYLLPDGRVIHVGGSEYATTTDVLDLNAQSWSVMDPDIVDGGSSTMYLPGKIMKAGSAADSQFSGSSSKTTFVLDTTQTSPAWVQTPSMVYPRSFFNLVTLPDDSVLAVGGETDKNGGNIANAVYAAELWSPQTQVWTTMSSMHTPREYHSTALLLPDGRVVVSGMGADFGNVPDEKTAEFFSPPYLFKGARPVITQAPGLIHYGANFFLATPDGATIASASLIRTGAATHFFDQNTRFVPVTFQQTAGGLTVSAPGTANLAPPGYYMLFIVNGNGVPSVAPIVQVGP